MKTASKRRVGIAHHTQNRGKRWAVPTLRKLLDHNCMGNHNRHIVPRKMGIGGQAAKLESL
jgi:hypothetical protein